MILSMNQAGERPDRITPLEMRTTHRTRREEWLSKIKSPEIERGLQPFMLHNTGRTTQTDIERERDLLWWERDIEGTWLGMCAWYIRWASISTLSGLSLCRREERGRPKGRMLNGIQERVILDRCGRTRGNIRH